MKYNFNYENADEFEDLLDLLESKKLIRREDSEIIPINSLCSLIPLFLSVPSTNDELMEILSDELVIYNTWFNGDFYTVETTLDQLANASFDWRSYYKKSFSLITPYSNKRIRALKYTPETLIQVVNSSPRGAFVFEDYIYY